MTPFILTTETYAETIGPLIIYGHYVYEWLDKGKCFYVGSGTSRRAWNTHNDQAEAIRCSSISFKVVILSHRLSKPLAHALERERTLFRIRTGSILTNSRIPK